MRGVLLNQLSALALLLPLPLLGCGDLNPTVPDDEVITLELCQPMPVPPSDRDTRCNPVADGTSMVTVTVCTPVMKDRPPDLKATVRLSSGRWFLPTDPTQPGVFIAKLGVDRCVDALLMTTTTPGLLQIEGEISGYFARSHLEIRPAPLTGIDFIATPPALDMNTRVATLRAIVRVPGTGVASTGTALLLEATGGYVTPATALIDSQSGVLATVTGLPGKPVTIKATATAPLLINGGLAPQGTVTGSITIPSQ